MATGAAASGDAVADSSANLLGGRFGTCPANNSFSRGSTTAHTISLLRLQARSGRVYARTKQRIAHSHTVCWSNTASSDMRRQTPPVAIDTAASTAASSAAGGAIARTAAAACSKQCCRDRSTAAAPISWCTPAALMPAPPFACAACHQPTARKPRKPQRRCAWRGIATQCKSAAAKRRRCWSEQRERSRR